MTRNTLRTYAYFLDRNERYKTQKPYDLRFEPDTDFPRDNLITIKDDNVDVEDVRAWKQDLSFAKNGFEIMSIDAQLQPHEFDDNDVVRSNYLPLIAQELKNLLGAARIQIHDYLVRKSHKTFPIATGEPYEYEQPATLVHIDSTPSGTLKIITDTNAEEAQDLASRRHQFVTVWKPIRGPVSKWPLMLCDNRTVKQNDLQARDAVYLDGAVETFLVHPSPDYRFYYLKDQTIEEAWVILMSDSQGTNGAPHTSFWNSTALATDPPRESIEVRCIVYY